MLGRAETAGQHQEDQDDHDHVHQRRHVRAGVVVDGCWASSISWRFLPVARARRGEQSASGGAGTAGGAITGLSVGRGGRPLRRLASWGQTRPLLAASDPCRGKRGRQAAVPASPSCRPIRSALEGPTVFSPAAVNGRRASRSTLFRRSPSPAGRASRISPLDPTVAKETFSNLARRAASYRGARCSHVAFSSGGGPPPSRLYVAAGGWSPGGLLVELGLEFLGRPGDLVGVAFEDQGVAVSTGPAR